MPRISLKANTFLLIFPMVVGLPAMAADSVPTFYKDVLPILQSNCQNCHRAGEAAPMSLMTYKEARPFAAAIKQSVAQKRMPPWNADAKVGHFANDRSLKQSEIDTLVSWASGGAPAGDPKQAPAAKQFAEGWSIGKPDFVVEMPEAFQVPASGTIDYHYVILPTNFKEDRWVVAAETRPMNRAVNHHIIAYVREPENQWQRSAPINKPFIPEGKSGGNLDDFLVGYAPGTMPEQLKPGQAKLLKAGSDLVLQLHWTANGKEALDKAKVGLIFAKEPPKERVLTVGAFNTRFEIPPGADNHRVEARIRLQEDSKLEMLIPHMHVRGKAFEMRAVLPTGEKVDLLRVPKYDFNWQLSYELAQPMTLPKGTIIEATGWFDNSINNKFNPDPKKTVRWGDQSWEEMMIGFFNVAVSPQTTLSDLTRPKKKPAASSAGVE